MPPRTKSLPIERNEAARKFARQLVAEKFEGNTLSASRKLGVSQSLLYEFLKGTRGAGMALLSALSTLTGEAIETITGQTSPDTESIENDPDFPHRAEAAREARRLGVREGAIRAVLRDAGHSDADLEVKFWLGEMQRREEFLARLYAPVDAEGGLSVVGDKARATSSGKRPPSSRDNTPTRRAS